MSNYSKSTDFAAKDDLLPDDTNKIVRGSEIDDEFAAIQTAVNSKADKLSPALEGIPTAPTATAGTTSTQLATTAFVQTAIQTLFENVYPVGSIYTSVVSTSPATLFGFGTWVEFGAGKVLVGQDTGDTSFDTLEETGGSKNAIVVSHTHSFSASATTSSAGSHSHGVLNTVNDGGATYAGGVTGTNGSTNRNSTSAGAHTHSVSVSGTTGSSGSSGTNANLQPYVVVKMWKRTA